MATVSSTQHDEFFKSKVLGHPAGLFVLFFTEMWERFSFYGMRVLLINFLTMAAVGYNPGWEWTAENAGALFGTYAMLLYITPILGGVIADKLTGYRWAVVIGAIIMTLGHAAMAVETEFWLYMGLGLLVVGTGFFKPTMTSIISEMYKDLPKKKDGAYTIFYMGVNAGAFFGMMLCGYLAERVGWSWGFGLAGVFMLLGTLQFWLAKPLFGKIGDVPSKRDTEEEEVNEDNEKEAIKYNPFTSLDKILIVITSIIGLAYAINDPLSKIANFNLFPFEVQGIEGQYVVVLIGLILFLYLVLTRISRYAPVVRNRMYAVIVFAFFTVLFFLGFEQGATSLVLFARDYIDRELIGNAAVIFNVVNALLTIVPLGIVSYVLFLLAKRTYGKIPGSNIVLIICFIGIWGVVLFMLNRDFNTTAYEVEFNAQKVAVIDEDTGEQRVTKNGDLVFLDAPVSVEQNIDEIDNDVFRKKMVIGEAFSDLKEGQEINIITKDKGFNKFGYLTPERLEDANENAARLGRDSGVVKATVTEVKNHWVEITASWFSILNSFFIIAFASLFSKWWESKYNPSAPQKYGIGLILLACGFGMLAFGSFGVADGVKVSMIWLILAYLFHTFGELCISPVGLSYVSKLVPARMIAFMFGMWYLAIAIGNKFAAVLGGQLENIREEYSLSTFFLIFTVVPILAGLLIIAVNRPIKKLMKGVD
ncbi:peptide MFS transporter [Aequorivita marina]|uniref:peptide MFS transporter n=1 Tax=Aequorivita marina TaxID=3073654 RepID=UPI0028752DCB|nr:peptide MFS transporter [Aequorivita sp. S2608]MDS1296889.1 peptide MFS transporter [Aequorivita sp. S2608]